MVATLSRSSSNSQSCTHPLGPRPTSYASPFRRRAARRQPTCLCVPLAVSTRRGAWSVACGGGRYVPGTAGASLACFLPLGVLMGACASTLRSIDAEWVMDKRDWKEAKRREKASAAAEKTRGGGGESGSGSAGASTSPPPLSPVSPSSSSSGAHVPASADDVEASAYRPEMDEMRCLLWAHGGQDPLCPGPQVLTVLFLFA